MRIKREGDQWTQSYSFDGANWTSQPSFTHILTVTDLGPYSGNGVGAGSPAHTASIDYFFNTASPIDPEDDIAGTVSTVAANTGGILGLSTANPCEVEIPVEIVRGGAENLRGFSATVNLTNLALCNGVASIQEGTYLSSVGATSFLIIDNLDGTFTVDGAILGSPCGAIDPTGVLFTIDVTNTVPDGTGTIDLTGLDLRDCDNFPLTGVSGDPADIVIDTTPPASVTDLTATQVLAGNPAGNVTIINLAWTESVSPDAALVAVYRKGFGAYPEYDDGGGSEPVLDPAATPGDAEAADWTLVDVTGETAAADLHSERDVWSYVAFTQDQLGNVSVPSGLTGGTLNYHLGDVSDGETAGNGDNLVNSLDISLLGSNYATVPTPTSNYLDVGPTTDYLVHSRPLTDNMIDFEDLIIFAINYDGVSKDLDGPEPASRNALTVLVPETPEGEFEAGLWLAADGSLKGTSISLTWNPDVVSPIGFEPGGLVAAQSGQGLVLSPAPGTVDFALFGAAEEGISGEGLLASITFKVLKEGEADIRVGEIRARDMKNKPQDLEATVTFGTPDIVDIPLVSVLHDNYPNPFNPMTTFKYGVAVEGQVSIDIYDLRGRLVTTLLNEIVRPGTYTIAWDGTDGGGRRVSSGIYLARFRAVDKTQIQRMTLIK
jgi:hypothetical protein